jgi:arginyl-tRNA synthetase
MNIEALISKAAGEAVKALYGMEASEKMLQLQKTRSEFEGNLTLVVFPFVKAAKKSPEQTAQEIGEYLQQNCSAIEKFNVVKGFLNLSIGDGAWLQLLSAIDQDENFGMKKATEDSPLVMIEYSSHSDIDAAARSEHAAVAAPDRGRGNCVLVADDQPAGIAAIVVVLAGVLAR